MGLQLQSVNTALPLLMIMLRLSLGLLMVKSRIIIVNQGCGTSFFCTFSDKLHLAEWPANFGIGMLAEGGKVFYHSPHSSLLIINWFFNTLWKTLINFITYISITILDPVQYFV